MKRRSAIKHLTISSSALLLYPACTFDKPLSYDRIPLSEKQVRSIALLADWILPTGELPLETQETSLDFILSVLNDTQSPEFIEKYVMGYMEFEAYVDENWHKKPKRLKADEQQVLLSQLESETAKSEALEHFYQTTKSLTKEHFRTSAYFMEEHLEYQFIKGPYQTCVPI